VFAAGDAITGGSTVILAMGQAKKAAAGIHKYLMGNSDEKSTTSDSNQALKEQSQLVANS
jgi:hypothetical protein